MIKLKSLIQENKDLNIEKFDNWKEFFYWEEYNIPKEIIIQIIKKFNLLHEVYFNGKIIKLYDNHKSIWLEKDGELYDAISNIYEWVSDFNDRDCHKYNINPDELYNPHAECSISDFRKGPIAVYHYTTEEKWKGIQEYGGLKGSYGTGLSNRNEFGIFTSIDPEEYSDGTYGDICLKIDLATFKKESRKLEISADWEPDIYYNLLQEYLRHVLNLDEWDSSSVDGISPYTIIVKENIPLKYITVYD